MFTCSSVDGHLDCFYLLDIVNSATVNISVYVFIWTVCSYLLGMCQGVEFAEPYGYSLFNLLRKVKLFSTVAHLNISTTMYENFNFATSLAARVIFCFI